MQFVAVKKPQDKSNNLRGFKLPAVTMKRKDVCYTQIPIGQRSWVTFNSPLWKRDRIKTEDELKTSLTSRSKMLSTLETGFVNDAIRTKISSTKSKPIIPLYDAMADRYSQAYFQSPLAQSIIEIHRRLDLLREQRNPRTLNKLSVRQRCLPTPDISKLMEMEHGFVNDAITTEKRRTKHKDIIPLYDASRDKQCRNYFEREDIKRLIKITCAPRFVPGRKSKTFIV